MQFTSLEHSSGQDDSIATLILVAYYDQIRDEANNSDLRDPSS